MHITLIFQCRDDSLTLHRAGDVVTFNGTAYDFGPLQEGAVLPRTAVDCPWLASDITRIDGELHLTLILPHGPIPVPPPTEALAVLFPQPIHVTSNGPIALPSWAPGGLPARWMAQADQNRPDRNAFIENLIPAPLGKAVVRRGRKPVRRRGQAAPDRVSI